MSSVNGLVGLILREMSPVIIEAFKVERDRTNIVKLEQIQREYLTGAQVVNMAEGLKVKVASCPTCAAKLDKSRGHEVPAHDISHETVTLPQRMERPPPATPSVPRGAAEGGHTDGHAEIAIPPGMVPPEKQPHTTQEHLRYTDEQIVKQLVLLEEHFKSYACIECIEKHLLGLEGYAEEGMGMDGPEPYGAVQEWARKAMSRKDYPSLYREARELRRKVQPHSHDGKIAPRA